MNKQIVGLGDVDITDAEINAVVSCLKSGRLSPGKIQKEFEEHIAEKSGYAFGTFVNSGQSALELSFAALKLKYPDLREVICPSTTYISTLAAIWNSGLEVVLHDVEADTYNMKPIDFHYDPARTALCPVNLSGLSNNVDKRYNNSDTIIVEDNCESIFAPHTGYGDFSCVSFFTSHPISTLGSGGMVLTNYEEADSIIKRLCNHGRQEAKTIYSGDRKDSYDRTKDFVFDLVGWSSKNNEPAAAFGLEQAKRSEEIIGRHISNGQRICKALEKYTEYLQLPIVENNTFMFLILTTKSASKTNLVNHLNDWQVETRSTMPIINQPVIQKILPRDYMNQELYPNSYNMLDKSFNIGTQFVEDKLEYIEFVFNEFFKDKSKWKEE